MSDWIQTYTGKQFHPLQPDMDLICIEDIAHALSLLCRFTGHCKHFYSVGQHSILAAQCAPDEYRLEALMHDGTEAYLNDMSSPVKNDIAQYRAIEFRLRLRIEERFHLKDAQRVIKKIDEALLYWEGYYLMPNVSTWNIKKPSLFIPVSQKSFKTQSSQRVEKQFLKIFKAEIKKRLGM